jgi:hypothetical protein
MSSLVIFTSITRNYLAKARVLAQSVKQHHPDVEFHCVVADFLSPEDGLHQIDEFDKVVDLRAFKDTLDPAWLFMHALVETCTTVKPLYLHRCLQQGKKKVIYLDPDTRLFSPITPVIDMLDNVDICLTPHVADVDYDRDSIRDNEISAAKHGVYNLGFFAVNQNSEGMAFARWWSDRVVNYGYAQTFMGSFTDQKICDFAPAYFDSIKIMRHPGLNVAHWNLNQREIAETPNGFTANGKPLIFYHFSSYDSGVGEIMSVKYSSQTRNAVDKIWQIYKHENDALTHYGYEQMPWTLSTFADGSPISGEVRLYYRQNEHLQYRFPDPFKVGTGSLKDFWENTPECRVFDEQWHATQAFLKTFRFARTDPFLTAKLSSVQTLRRQPPQRLFIYGANEFGYQVVMLATSMLSCDIVLLDRDSTKLLAGLTAHPPEDFRFTQTDAVIVCGKAHEQEMRDTIGALSDGAPALF